MNRIDTERFRTDLTERRAQVVAAIENIRGDHPGDLLGDSGELASAGSDQHLADTATDTYDRELDAGLELGEEQLLGEIDAALARLDGGTFGSCRTCGKEIGLERLEALPYATQCIDDKRREEA